MSVSIEGIINYLGDLLVSILQGILYIVTTYLNVIFGFISKIINNLMFLYNSIVGLGNNIINYLITFLSDLLPYTWITLIILGFLIVIILRIYHYLKDIEIAGFKI